MIMPKIKPTKLALAALAIVALIAAAWFFLKPKQEQPQYITAAVSRGDIEN